MVYGDKKGNQQKRGFCIQWKENKDMLTAKYTFTIKWVKQKQSG